MPCCGEAVGVSSTYQTEQTRVNGRSGAATENEARGQNLIGRRVSSLISQNKGFERPTDPHRSIRTTMGPPIHVGNARTARNAAIVPRHGRLGLLWCARDSSCRHPWRLQRARIALLRVLGDPSGQHETRCRDSPGNSALHPARAALASLRGGCLPRIEPRSRTSREEYTAPQYSGDCYLMSRPQWRHGASRCRAVRLRRCVVAQCDLWAVQLG